MTNENIIKQLKRLIPFLQYADDVNAVKGAIQSLSQEGGYCCRTCKHTRINKDGIWCEEPTCQWEQAVTNSEAQEPCEECKYKTFTELYFHTDPEMVEQEPCDKCVYSTKDGYCQYDDITEAIPPLKPCDNAASRILQRMWNCRGKHTTSIDKVAMEQIIRDELSSVTQKCEKCAMNGSGSKYCDNCGQKSGKWIPVSERLPELKQRVLVSYETMDDGKKVDITIYDKHGFLIGGSHAWMPLPKPYEPQESEDEE